MDIGLATPLKEDQRQTVSAIDALTLLVSDDLTKVNELITQRMDSAVSMIPDIAGYLIYSGGKRLRPLITLAAAKLCGYQGEDHTKLAASVEFIHTATLLHDDVVDESALRRGHDSANVVWGNQASVLVGDYLFSRAFNLMVETGNLKVLDILSHTSSIIAEGEVLQLVSSADMKTSKKTYMDIVMRKTAALFSAAACVGAVIAGRSPREEEALNAFGRDFGIAFQLIDDALDYAGLQEQLGKTVGDDFREGKITLPVVLAYERGSEEERAFWRRTMEEPQQGDGDFSQAIELLALHRGIKDTMDLAKDYAEKAHDALMILPDNCYRRSLDNIITFCVDRAY